MEPLVNDEMIEESQAVKREHAASFDFDIERIITDLKKSEWIHTEQGLTLVKAKKTPPPLDTAFKLIRFAHR